jgi:hypothetical protein
MPTYIPLWSIQPPTIYLGAENPMLYAWGAFYAPGDPPPANYTAEVYVGGVLTDTIKGIQPVGEGSAFGLYYKQFGIEIGQSYVQGRIASPDYADQAGMNYANIWADALKTVSVVLHAFVEDANGFIVAQAALNLESDTCVAIKGGINPYDRNATGYSNTAFWINQLGNSFGNEYALPLSNKPLRAMTCANSLEQLSFIRNNNSPKSIGVIYTQEDGTTGGCTMDLPSFSSPYDYVQISTGPEAIFLNAVPVGPVPTGPLAYYQFFLLDGSTVSSPVFERVVAKCAAMEVLFMSQYGAFDAFTFIGGLFLNDSNSSAEIYKLPLSDFYASVNASMQRGRDMAVTRSDTHYSLECDLLSYEAAWLTELQRTGRLYLNDINADPTGWIGGMAYGWLIPVTRDNAEAVRSQWSKEVTRFRLTGTYAMTLPTVSL